MVCAAPDGAFVLVSDIARVELGAETQDSVAGFNGKPTAMIRVYIAPGANALQTAEAVQAALKGTESAFPQGMHWQVPYSAVIFIESSIDEVIKTLFDAFGLVVIVVFLFLGSLRMALLPLIAVPVSLVGALSFMLALGFSLNTVSLLALVLAIGIVVDDAIVVIENVEKVMEERPELSVADATSEAMGQITATILAITFVLLPVFVPVAFVPGIAGVMFQQFAVAVSFAMLISALNALTDAQSGTVHPPLRPRSGPRRGPLAWFSRRIDNARDGYAFVAGWFAHRAVFGLVFLGLAIVGAGALFRIARRRVSCRSRTRAPFSYKCSCRRARRSTKRPPQWRRPTEWFPAPRASRTS